jgi:hypothetical protein
VVEIARPAAAKVLLDNYREVQAEISQRFAEVRNPLESARDAIVRSHEDAVRRGDAEKRRGVLAEIDAIVGALPGGEA